MESIFDRLPIPRSRPAWMASLLLFLLGSVLYLVFQVQFIELHLTSVYYTERLFTPDDPDMEINLTYPRFYSEQAYFPVKGEFSLESREQYPMGDLTIVFESGGKTYSATQEIAFSQINKKIDFYQTIQVNDLRAASNNDASLALYYGATFDSSLKGEDLQEITFINSERDFHIREDRLMSILLLAVDRLVQQGNIYWVLLAFAAISGWVMEDKSSQELWLANRKGWLAVRSIFLRAFPLFFFFCFVLFLLISFTDQAKLVLLAMAILVLIYWFFQPSIKEWAAKRAKKHR